MAYCPSCGDEIAIDAPSCPTCDAMFGASSAWHPLVEPPPDRDFERIADFRAKTERQRLGRERVLAETQEQRIHVSAEAPPIFRITLALLIGYLVASFLGAVYVAVVTASTPGALVGAFLILVFPVLPVWFVSQIASWTSIDRGMAIVWSAGFVVCSVVAWNWLNARHRDKNDA